MPGCVPHSLVMIIDAMDGAVFDFGPPQSFVSGSRPDDVPLGRDEPGSIIELAPTTKAVTGGPGGMNGFTGGDGNGLGGVCVSRNSVLSSDASSSVVGSVVKARSRRGRDAAAEV